MTSAKLEDLSDTIDALPDDALTKFFIYATIVKMLVNPNTFDMNKIPVGTPGFAKQFPANVALSVFEAQTEQDYLTLATGWFNASSNARKDNDFSRDIDYFCKDFSRFESGIMPVIRKIVNLWFEKDQLSDLSLLLDKMKTNFAIISIQNTNPKNYELYFKLQTHQKDIQEFLNTAVVAKENGKLFIKNIFLCGLLFLIHVSLNQYPNSRQQYWKLHASLIKIGLLVGSMGFCTISGAISLFLMRKSGFCFNDLVNLSANVIGIVCFPILLRSHIAILLSQLRSDEAKIELAIETYNSVLMLSLAYMGFKAATAFIVFENNFTKAIDSTPAIVQTIKQSARDEEDQMTSSLIAGTIFKPLVLMPNVCKKHLSPFYNDLAAIHRKMKDDAQACDTAYQLN